jgi:hypothetical protein
LHRVLRERYRAIVTGLQRRMKISLRLKTSIRSKANGKSISRRHRLDNGLFAITGPARANRHC